MTLAVVHSRATEGVHAPLVAVEVDISNGFPSLSIVGLPETAVKEAKDRVRAALINSNYEFPAARITVNLAPADLPKEGGRYDLPIALGILAASGQIPDAQLNSVECIGELALSGELRPVKGVLPVAIQTRNATKSLIIPRDNLHEANLVPQLDVISASHLLDVCRYFAKPEEFVSCRVENVEPLHDVNRQSEIAEVQGQFQAKRALEIAASGNHNLLMIGPPGTGKTMLASRLPSILPTPTEQEALETAAIYSISDQGFDAKKWRVRAFRSPHHTASSVALVGGGSNPRPGEISLAHNGVLFLDELPEFDRRVLEVLREPLESGKINISRAARQVEFPARFQLIAAMNPCPCGFLSDASGRCRCTVEQVQRYRSRISGPLLDRIDLQLEVPRQAIDPNKSSKTNETSDTVRQRVAHARDKQIRRQEKLNSQLSPDRLTEVCALNIQAQNILRQAADKLQLSMRAYHRTLKVARTIADLADANHVGVEHLMEALSYRSLDRKL